MRLCRRAALLAALFAAPALAAWPDRPVTVVVPYAAGGGTDIVGREFAQLLQEKIGQPVVIENRGGAGGHVGTMLAARAKPDGYTLLYAVNSNIVINPSLYRTEGLEFTRDLIPLGQVAIYQYVLVVDPRLPLRSLADVVAMAKAKPGEVTFSHSGVGGNNHLAGAMFGQAAGIQLDHVSYRGTAPALLDVVAGRVTMNFSSPPPAVPLVREGQVRAVAVTGDHRHASFPDVPTMQEQGLPGFEITGWHGLFVPRGAPQEAIDRLMAATRDIARSSRLHEKLGRDGLEPAPDRPHDAFVRQIADETVFYARVVRELGVKIE